MKILNKIGFVYKNYFEQRLGIDFGTSSVKISCPIRGLLVDEPSVIIVNGSDVVAVGKEADEMVAKIPSYYRVIYPIKNGLIYDFDAAEIMMEYFFKKVYKNHKNKIFKPSPKIVLAHGTNTTPIQEKNLKELFLKLGASSVYFISQTVAAAIGADIDIEKKESTFLFNIGSGTSELLIISGGNIIESKIINNAGIYLTKSIKEIIFQKEKLQISFKTAERLKINYGDLSLSNNNEDIKIIGQDKFMNIPKEITIKAKNINQAINYNFKFIFEEFMKIIDKINPDIAEDLYKNGMYILGGSSDLEGLDSYVSKLLNIKVKKFKNPRMLSVQGCVKIIGE